MGGTVNKVVDTFFAATNPVASVAKSAVEDFVVGEKDINKNSLIRVGAAPARATAGALKEGVGLAAEAGQAAGLLPKPPEGINIGMVDPAQAKTDDSAARARAKRQAEIDLLTDRPGRGGTILTDNYSYKV